MAYDTQNILNGERVYDVLKELAESEEGSYGSEIADKLGIKQQSASEIINRLHDRGLLEKGKRTKAQYYEIDPSGFVDIFGELVEKEILEDREIERDQLEDYLEIQKEGFEQFGDYSMDEALERDFPVFFRYYVAFYLTSVEQSTIRRMVFEDFFEGILTYESGARELPGWFYYIKAIAREKYGFFDDPSSIVGAALMEYESLPDTIEKRHTYHIFPEGFPSEKPEFYDLKKEGDTYVCSKCGEEVEDFEVGAKSPCGCGVIRTRAEIKLGNIQEDNRSG